MGFHQKSSATVFLALLGLGSILGVNGSWLFGAMEEREEDHRRAMQPRQFVQCSTGSKACGVLGCVATGRCCNADAGWGCLPGNACYTAGGFIDCYSTTMVMPTISRKCYDFAQTGCTGGQACFKCGSTAAFCATEVIAGGGDTWLECSTKSTILFVTAAAETSSGSDSSTTDDSNITPTTGRTGISTPIRTGTTTGIPTPTSSPSSSGLGGGAIAGIVIGAVAGIAILAALIFFLCVKKGDSGANGAAAVQQQYPQQQQQQMYPPQPPYSPPPQQQYAPQPPYSPLPGYQGQMAHNGYGPDGQPMAPMPVSSPVYPEPSKQQPPTMPAELSN